jgi:hypothetical protein
MDLEITCQFPRDQLLGLLNTMTPIEQQRITAEMPAVVPPAEVAIRFRPPRRRMHVRLAVIAASFAVSLGLGLVVALV